MGYFDEDGFLHIVDRIKELIKHNRYQVAPAELEAILLGHPQVLDAAVIPVEDEEAGQTPMAYLVLNSQKNKSFNLLLISPIQESTKSGFHQRHSKVCCGQNLEEGACFPQPTSYLKIVTFLRF